MGAARPLNGPWRDYFLRRLVSPEEAVSHAKSGDRIFLPMGQNPEGLLSALSGRLHELEGIQLTGTVRGDYGWFTDEMQGHISVDTTFIPPQMREAANQHRCDTVPWAGNGALRAIMEGRPEARPLDVTLVDVAPPDEQGFCCLGKSVWEAQEAVSHAALVLAQVNRHVIQTFGDTRLHVSQIDYFVEYDQPPTLLTYPDPDPADRAIAEHVRSLLHSGDAFQIGLGKTTGNLIPLGAFAGKEDLGFFSELSVPGVVGLVREGAITSRYLKNHPGKVVATTIGNSPEDLEFVNNNPKFELHRSDYVIDPRGIAQNDNVVAINMAMAVDLTGQVAAGSIGPRLQSGTGGHLAFALGAWFSRGGRYMCILPSTAQGGKVSRILPQFPPGQVVTVPRDLADLVVTEYGVARLLNKPLRERAAALIEVAHPDFRAELRREARRLLGR
ncbi:MAG: 4-hydroxybutyrate CoA transferase [Chloroflexi bacterium]|nr:4-hydroxybutyrate CoA transferase [Chloroflexota bacterium]